MAIKSTDTLKEGMVLESPIKNEQGQVLFGVNHVLKEKHIDMLMAWGIPEADVIVEGDDEEEQRIEEMITIEIEKIRPRFVRCDLEHPVVQETMRCVSELTVHEKLRKEREMEGNP